jgi:hypothetical protein
MPGTAHRRGAERDPARALGAFRPRPGVLATVPGSTVFSLRGGVVVVPRGVPAPPRPARANRLSGPGARASATVAPVLAGRRRDTGPC